MREKIKIGIDLELDIAVKTAVRNVVNEASKQVEPTDETVVAKITEEAVKTERKRRAIDGRKMKHYNNNIKSRNHTRIIQAARQAVHFAVKRGELIRPEICSNCGNGSHEPIHGHHECYHPENHLDVDWLCRSCHKKLHNNKEKNGGTPCRKQESHYL